MTDAMTYQIWDNGGVMRLGAKQVGTDYVCRKRARTRAERLNLEYGAHRYSVRAIWPTHSTQY